MQSDQQTEGRSWHKMNLMTNQWISKRKIKEDMEKMSMSCKQRTKENYMIRQKSVNNKHRTKESDMARQLQPCEQQTQDKRKWHSQTITTLWAAEDKKKMTRSSVMRPTTRKEECEYNKNATGQKTRNITRKDCLWSSRYTLISGMTVPMNGDIFCVACY